MSAPARLSRPARAILLSLLLALPLLLVVQAAAPPKTSGVTTITGDGVSADAANFTDLNVSLTLTYGDTNAIRDTFVSNAQGGYLLRADGAAVLAPGLADYGAAVNAALAAGHAHVRLPRGTLPVLTSISVTVDAAIIEGSGRNATILSQAADVDVISVDADDVTVRSLAIVGPASGATKDGIYAQGQRNKFLDLRVEDTYNGIRFYGSGSILSYFNTVSDVLIEDCRNVGVYTDGDATKDSNHNFLNVDVKRCDGDGVYLLRNNKWIGGQSSYNDGYGFNFGAGTGATNLVLSYAESNDGIGTGKTGSQLATPPLTSAAFNAFVGANPTLQLYDPRYDARGSTGLMEIRYRGSDDYLEFNRPLFPDASGTRDLGSGLTRWGDAYVDRLDAGGAIDSASIIKSTRTSGSSVAFAAEISGESASRFTVGANGKLSWGDGTGADTELSRGAANRLDLGSDDTLRVSAGVDWQTSTLGTCASGLRGQMQWVEGASTVADELWVCRKKADDTYAWAKATFT